MKQFFRLYRRREMHRPERRRRGHEHEIAIRGDRFLIRIIAAKTLGFRQAVFLAGLFRGRFEGIRRGHQFCLDSQQFRRRNEILQSIISTASAADQRHFDFLIGRADLAKDRRHRKPGSEQRGIAEKCATIE